MLGLSHSNTMGASKFTPKERGVMGYNGNEDGQVNSRTSTTKKTTRRVTRTYTMWMMIFCFSVNMRVTELERGDVEG